MVIIRTLEDQINEWTEGQHYPGAYQKKTDSFQLPYEPTAYVLESSGVLYAYGNPLNEEGTRRTPVVRKYEGGKESNIVLSEIPENYGLSGMYALGETVWLLARPNETIEDTEKSHLELFTYTTEGVLRSREKLTDLTGAGKVIDANVTGFTDNKGNLWLRIPEAGMLYGITSEGRLFQKITIPSEFLGGFMRGKEEDHLLAVLGTGSGLVFSRMNTRNGTSETYIIESLPGIQSVYPGTEYDALIMTEKSLYGVTLGEPVLLTELFVFTDLGVDQSILRSIEDHEDGSLSVILLSRTKTEGERVSLVPRTAKVREGLTLACLKSNEYLLYAVSAYNTENPDNKITIKEYYDKYAVDASETDAMNRLNSDLMDGTAGDIICLDGLNFAGKANAYLEKGLFVDLYELMDNDPEFNIEDYFTDIFRVNETDGKLYRLVPFFSLNTRHGRVDDVGVVTHLDEAILFEAEPVTSLYGPMYRRTEFIHDLLVFSLGDVRDRNASLYDTEQMVRYIELAGKMPEFELYQADGDPEAYSEYHQAVDQRIYDFNDHKIRFCYSTMESAYFLDVRSSSSLLGEPGLPPHEDVSLPEAFRLHRTFDVQVSYCGFPMKEGCGSAVINQLTLAMSSAAENQEEAWRFLKTTLSEAYQSTKKLSYSGIPVNRSVLQFYVERLMAYQGKEDDPQFLAGFGSSNPETGEDITYWFPVTQQYMVDEFIDLLADITKVDEVDPNVEAIVTEEIAKYCDGRETAEEAAKNIAERAGLYADEL